MKSTNMAESNATEFKFVHKNNLRFVLGITLSMLILSIVIDVRPLIFLSIFSIMGALFMIYERYVQMPVDFELFTFFTILMTLKYGLFWGMITGVSTKLSAVLYNKDFNRNTVFSLSAYVMAAIITNFFHNFITNIIFLSLLVVLLTNIFTFLVFRLVVQMQDVELFMYGASNFLFNVVIVMGFSQIFVGLMAFV